jgi:uncharacterized membrane protein
LTKKHTTDSSFNDYVVQLIKNQKPETVNQLIELIKQKYPLSEEAITELLAKLESEGKIRLNEKEASVPMTTLGYVFSREASWYWTTILLAIATTITAFIVPEDVYPIVYVRYVLGSVFVLLLPGYSLIKAVFPLKREIDIVERIAFSMGLSLALVPVVVLILNYSPWGIGFTPIILSLLALTLTFATVAIIREQQTKTKEAQAIP